MEIQQHIPLQNHCPHLFSDRWGAACGGDVLSYTSFEQPSVITESPYQATFKYNTEGQRAQMAVTQNGSAILTRWYAGSRYIRETAGSTTKEFTWIGGDAYTAPCVAIKTNTGSQIYYYLLRDHLGTITHVTNASGTVQNQYSFDAWGRRRNFSNWGYTVAAQTDLLPARGFTGHEWLPWFNLYNMNGRLGVYPDESNEIGNPVVDKFLSPDNNVQMPDFSQNFNRYSYCLNNPLKYTDPTGEKWRWGNPLYHFDRLAQKFMDWVNKKFEPLRDARVDADKPEIPLDSLICSKEKQISGRTERKNRGVLSPSISKYWSFR